MSEDRDIETGHMKASGSMVDRAKDMIEDPASAISELIKNSYDADAEKVLINLKDSFKVRRSECQLVIHDDGNGMTKEDIHKGWLTMGSSQKRGERKWSPNKARRVQGKFGLGRFGVARIGKQCILVTRSEGGPLIEVAIDWTKFTDEVDLDEVEIPIRTNPEEWMGILPTGTTGTYIYIKNFVQKLRGTSLSKIHKQLQTLINPFDMKTDFDIILRAPKSKEKWNDFAIKQIADQAQYRFEASIDNSGQEVEWEFHDQHPWSTAPAAERSKTGTWHVSELTGKEGVIRNSRIWINYFNRARGKEFNELVPSIKGLPGKVSRKDMDQITGFKLFIGGVRIYPYGELRGGDWLDLTSKWSNAPTSWIKQNSLVAAIDIDADSNPGIEQTTARTGIQDGQNDEKARLIELLQEIVKKMRKDLCNPWINKKPAELGKPDFSYDIANVWDVEQEIWIQPRHRGSIPRGYSVTCEVEGVDGERIRANLPEGLVFDRETGQFTGVIGEPTESDLYLRVNGWNAYGEHPAEFQLSVRTASNPLRCISPACRMVAVTIDGWCSECYEKNRLEAVVEEKCEKCELVMSKCVCDDTEGSRERRVAIKVSTLARELEESCVTARIDDMREALEVASSEIAEILDEITDE